MASADWLVPVGDAMTDAMMASPITRAATVALALLVLAACASSPTASVQWGGSCEVQACVCEEPSPLIFKTARTAEIIWSVDGKASCPAGLILRRKPSE